MATTKNITYNFDTQVWTADDGIKLYDNINITLTKSGGVPSGVKLVLRCRGTLVLEVDSGWTASGNTTTANFNLYSQELILIYRLSAPEVKRSIDFSVCGDGDGILYGEVALLIRNNITEPAEGVSKTYVDEQDVVYYNNAKVYANTIGTTTLASATAYADAVGTATLDSAITYSDSNLAEATAYTETNFSAATAYANTVGTVTLDSATAYTDDATSGILTEAKGYADGVGYATLDSATAYADSASETAVATANRYAEGYADLQYQGATIYANSVSKITANGTLQPVSGVSVSVESDGTVNINGSTFHAAVINNPTTVSDIVNINGSTAIVRKVDFVGDTAIAINGVTKSISGGGGGTATEVTKQAVDNAIGATETYSDLVFYNDAGEWQYVTKDDVDGLIGATVSPMTTTLPLPGGYYPVYTQTGEFVNIRSASVTRYSGVDYGAVSDGNNILSVSTHGHTHTTTSIVNFSEAATNAITATVNKSYIDTAIDGGYSGADEVYLRSGSWSSCGIDDYLLISAATTTYLTKIAASTTYIKINEAGLDKFVDRDPLSLGTQYDFGYNLHFSTVTGATATSYFSYVKYATTGGDESFRITINDSYVHFRIAPSGEMLSQALLIHFTPDSRSTLADDVEFAVSVYGHTHTEADLKEWLGATVSGSTKFLCESGTFTEVSLVAGTNGTHTLVVGTATSTASMFIVGGTYGSSCEIELAGKTFSAAQYGHQHDYDSSEIANKPTIPYVSISSGTLTIIAGQSTQTAVIVNASTVNSRLDSIETNLGTASAVLQTIINGGTAS